MSTTTDGVQASIDTIPEDHPWRHLFASDPFLKRLQKFVRIDRVPAARHKATDAIVSQLFMKLHDKDNFPKNPTTDELFPFLRRVIRHHIIDTIRKSKLAKKRGSEYRRTDITEGLHQLEDPQNYSPDRLNLLLDYSLATTAIEKEFPDVALVLDCRVHGLTQEEITDRLSLSIKQVRRLWRLSEDLLHEHLNP